MPFFFAVDSTLERKRSVSNMPGSTKLMVTLEAATRSRDAGKERGQAGARAGGQVEADERHFHRAGRDVDDAAEFLGDHRSRSTFWISSTATTMLAMTPSIIFCRSSSRKSRNGGPALLLTRMSGSGQAANSAFWPSGEATSPATGMILAPVFSQLVGRRGEVLLVAAVDHHLAAGLGQRLGAGAAQARGSRRRRSPCGRQFQGPCLGSLLRSFACATAAVCPVLVTEHPQVNGRISPCRFSRTCRSSSLRSSSPWRRSPPSPAGSRAMAPAR